MLSVALHLLSTSPGQNVEPACVGGEGPGGPCEDRTACDRGEGEEVRKRRSFSLGRHGDRRRIQSSLPTSVWAALNHELQE